MQKILVIGGGSIGERHLRCFLKTGRAEVALCDVREEIRTRITNEYAVSGTYPDLDAALAQPFDAAVICTPAHLHVQMAQRLAGENLALLIEKPLSISTTGVAELIQLVEEKRLPVSIAYVYHAHPVLRGMKQSLASGRFGKPVQVVMTSGQHFPFYRPAYREIYYTKHETGGGAIQDALTHMVNAAEWLVGPVTKLVADAEHCVLEGVEVEDTVNMITRHGPVLGSFSLNQHQAPNDTLLTIICEQGTVRYEGHNTRWLSCTEPGQPWNVEEEFQLERDDLFINQAQAFLDQLENQSEPACSLAAGFQTLRVNLATLESVRTGKWVTL